MANIYQQSRDVARREAHQMAFDVGVVVTSDHDAKSHQVIVRTERFNQDGVPCLVPVDAEGDVHVPDVGDRVLVGFRSTKKPVILGYLYRKAADVPQFEPGERVLSHAASDSTIRLKPNGDVEIDAEGDVIHNGGSKAPVTDVSTSTDSDGHVTSVSTTKANETKVE